MRQRVIHLDTIEKIDDNLYKAKQTWTLPDGRSFGGDTYINEADLKRVKLEQRILDLGGTDDDISLLDEIIQEAVDHAIAEHEAGENL